FTDLKNEIVVVDVHDEESSMFPREPDSLVIDQARMLYGIDAGQNRFLDRLRAVGMRSDLAPQAVRLDDELLHLFGRILRGAGLVPLGKDAAARANLDEIGAVFDDLSNFGPRFPGSVGHAALTEMKLGRQQIVVAMPAGDAE